MEKALLFKVSLSKILGFWCLLQSKIWHISCFGGVFAFFSHLSPSFCSSPGGIPRKGIWAAPQGPGACAGCGVGVKDETQKGGEGLRTGDRGWSSFKKLKGTDLTA